MCSLIHVDQFPQSDQLLAKVGEEFAKGAESVALVKGAQIIGTILSRSASQKALARKVAEQWLANPDVLKDLAVSLDEKPEAWD